MSDLSPEYLAQIRARAEERDQLRAELALANATITDLTGDDR